MTTSCRHCERSEAISSTPKLGASNIGHDPITQTLVATISSPHLGELRLVGGPDLVLREPAEGFDIGGVDRHALGFEQLLGLGDIVDALGQLADRLLRGARGVRDQLLMGLGEAVPDVEIDDRRVGP